MQLQHARRLPIPTIFRDASRPGMEQKNNNAADTSPIPSSSPPNLPPSPPILLSSRRNCILPASSEKKVKYSPSTRGFKIIPKGFVRPKSPPPPQFDQNASPVPSLGSASDDLTLNALTPPLCKEKESSRVFMERTNALSSPTSGPETLIEQDDKTSKDTPPKQTLPADAKEEHILTAISTSIDGNMNMDASTAHLQAAASLRSIRRTLKNRSHSRQSLTPRTQDIPIPENKISNTKDTTEAPVSPPANKAPETISDLISQLIRNRFRPDHRKFMTTWSAAEIEIYDERWKKLIESSKSVSRWPHTRFSAIPWPVLPSVIISLSSPDIIDHTNVTRFLLCPHRDQEKSSLERISAELERWNDFELMGRVLENVRQSDKKKVEAAWSRVVMVLMEVRGDLMART